jgi:hypothetical protein
MDARKARIHIKFPTFFAAIPRESKITPVVTGLFISLKMGFTTAGII